MDTWENYNAKVLKTKINIHRTRAGKRADHNGALDVNNIQQLSISKWKIFRRRVVS